MSLKDKLSNILAIVIGLGTVVATALETVPSDAQWYVWAAAIAITTLSYFTGKDGDLKKSA